MNQQLNSRERELVKAANQFKKRAQSLIKAGKLSDEHQQVAAACDNLLQQVYNHAEYRSVILQQHESLKKIVKDNAECPRCHKSDQLKLKGVDPNEKGWKMNRYRCRRCNIDFTWNRPNNPWDMLKFVEEMLVKLDESLQQELLDPQERAQTLQVRENVVGQLSRLKPVVEETDQNVQAVHQKDEDMAQMLHDFKNYLLIETIKLDTWDNQ